MRLSVGDELAVECLKAMDAWPENALGVLTTYLNQARAEGERRTKSEHNEEHDDAPTDG